jgi:lipopolysaccharide/colanic/teichoic acid biosynthesis glycosyltransferase
MLKRLFDVLFSIVVLIALSPILLGALLLVYLQDRHSPIYRAPRVGRSNIDFTMVKIRSMRAGADKSGVTSTSATDSRITPIGHLIRQLKLDEVAQFWNVLFGDMSVVGPRPNSRRNGVDLYTTEEMHLLDARPGITDLSSIVFSDEGSILAGAPDADELYNRIIRPWKSRLGLLYVRNASLTLDLRIIWLTAMALVSKARALEGVEAILRRLGAEPDLIAVCRRDAPLPEGEPPGGRFVTA